MITAELHAAATASDAAVAAATLPSCHRGMGAGGRVAAPKAHLIVMYIFYRAAAIALCATAELRAAATAAYAAVAAAPLPSCRRGMGAGGRVAAPKAHLIVMYIFYSPLKNMVGYKFSLSSPPR